MAQRAARKIDHLPTLPAILDRLIQTLDDPVASAMDIERIVDSDQAIASRLLAVANSAYYGLHNTVTTVSRAVVVLGINEVRSICMRAALAALLNPRQFTDPKAAQRIWLHSLTAQEAARMFSNKSLSLGPEVAVTAALLHDLGWVVIMGYYQEDWLAIQRALEKDQLSSAQAEEAVGFGHQKAGRMLALQWDLPPALTEVISRHHDPDPNSNYFELCEIVQLADFLACSLGAGPFETSETPALDSRIPRDLKLDTREIMDCQAQLEERLEGLREMWKEMTAP